MANLRIIKRRIRSVRNIAKITRAMEMIAASKMKKAQERGLAGRPYSEKITEVIAALAALPQSGEILHPLLERRPVKKIAILHITPDRGQCGGLVANINRKTGTFIMEQKVPVSAVVVGRKGVDFIRRIRQQMRAEFINLGDKPDYLDTLPISRVIMDDFMSGEIDQVFIAYTQFVSTAIQNPVLEQLLPVVPVEFPPGQNLEYIYEPESAAVLNSLLPRFVEMSVYHAILESIASEQSARMVAMRNATDNAKELIGELTLVYNKARQESITNELLDIVGGAAALA
ncbi:ATP synthase F1 subunit gamma [Dehalococcoides mccartyi]|jgi:ATP synthase F1 subcomplex gamma subunit |uniref:ATP synthase gamma chain n=1 Tax=Dehalococcoides mccartyi TaxID=61435 RepID=A0A142V9K8_9CHLR|nr:ATP synthase F1 subunit gamma [Dehalococcoides mccartyi]AII60662.1 F0F1 ATP synthase subunit gamma [Dehalococcoides mccartyi CG5]AMU86329.1 F-type H+-transporting ATPase subunit gamma [Dehalococcoides mccartyi]AOV99162.1 ATP synthase gamma chain [Dehalococcoides mccartyi]AQX74376.1 ATP synthase F1 subunit gamma [Dehalococcoides mccartyi]AQY72953.1 ATP synthase F1 subunit gamma [Dehalococcoides mccartyi]